ncbi:MAG: AAA family ATPase [Planctomycetaceae bacterium]|nr:AAA family ATPase [Planctomycetaceae bacterium]
MNSDVPPSDIEVIGARVHNLRNLSLRIPRGKITVLAGVCGAGKSSLAFDTLHAESQRRFVETLSPSTRLFVTQMERPDVERIDHLPATLAVGHSGTRSGGTETIAETCEILDYLGLLACHVGQTYCPSCQIPVLPDRVETLAGKLSSLNAGERMQIAVSLEMDDRTEMSLQERISQWEASGFHRFWHLTAEQRTDLMRTGFANLQSLVIVDRLVAGKCTMERLVDSLEQAYAVGRQACWLLLDGAIPASFSANPRGSLVDESQRKWTLLGLTEERRCTCCGMRLPELDASLFRRPGLADDAASLARQATACNVRYPQVAGPRELPAPPSLSDLLAWPVSGLIEYVAALRQLWGESSRSLAEILSELAGRLEALDQLGLAYLGLERRLESLSTGERQRVRLAAAEHTQLVGMLCLLDEPCRGLHPADVSRVRQRIRGLLAGGNSVLMVEHDTALLRAADHVIELGPGAGPEGGRVVFAGSPRDLLNSEESVTGRWLSGREHFARPGRVPLPDRQEWLSATGISGRNLQDLAIEIPRQRLTMLTGVSGSGKSTLLVETLFPALSNRLASDRTPQIPSQPGCTVESLVGWDVFDQVVLMSDDEMGASQRSTPVTYLQAYDEIRRLFAETTDAQARGYTASQFSFNTPQGGRCEHCKGIGQVELDLQVLPSMSIPCPSCHGARFNAETLEVQFRNRNIRDVLDMNADEAFQFFRNQPILQRRLQMLREVGLGYLPLGQPSRQLSQGEQQRLKLAAHLIAATGKQGVYLFDEPANGLHPADVACLLQCLFRLIEQGHTVVVIDHHPMMIQHADWIIDLGPGAAEQGGKVVFSGTPEDLLERADSLTARHLRERLAT